jgi:uncharacterized protein (UPF0332 family)
MNDFKRCLELGRIVKVDKNKDWIKKELEEAEYDFARSKASIEKEDCKWAIVQGYYSMFHAAKALVLSEGYRERSHQCLIIALRELFVKTDRLDEKFTDQFENAMDLRHQADYGLE